MKTPFLSKKLLSFFLLPFSFSLFAQSTQDSLPATQSGRSVGLKVQYGFIIPHSQAIAEQAYSNPMVLQGEWAWQLAREKTRQTFGSFPRVGVHAWFIDFDNAEVLGQGIGITPFFESFLWQKNTWQLSFKMGTGLVYLNKIYDEQRNPQNLFYSAPLSFLLYFDLSAYFRLSSRWQLQLSTYYNHISNGGMQLPNKGINFPTASIGFLYHLRPAIFPHSKVLPWRTLYQDRQSWHLNLLATATTVAEGDEKRYPIVGVVLYFQQIVGRLSTLNFGAEWIADEASRELSRRASENISAHKASLWVGHELMLGRFRFSQALGVYLWNEQKGDSRLYQRYGLEWYWLKRCSIGFNLKSHGDVADFMDLRLGYSW
ncbi:MAG: acyloxyacyl hydrolase [Cytophagales bacterium]|nr:MAG: acyloxyacyl hydrolase [Cytophagales bacterium]